MICELEGSDLYICIESFRDLFTPIPDENRIYMPYLELSEKAVPLSAKLQTRQGSKLSVDFILSVVPETSNLRGIDVFFSPPEETDIARMQRVEAKVKHEFLTSLLNGRPIKAYYGTRNAQIHFKFLETAGW